MDPPRRNEIGIAPARGLPEGDREETERSLSESLGTEIKLGPHLAVSRSPESCPACGSTDVIWGCDDEQRRSREEIHPLVWHETALMADSYICRDCDAGWTEGWKPETITWVRPYWRVGDEEG